ncbi:MAG: hypothetical protein GF383_09885 [Candidatus Lokiarchaeota archaeon]|nr:hypothetical protein [Candidatus Lokiarchaeota archaeon]MBD3340841.1 hypothetical protein [Candidatus Lokiarchaeota archaeon]
MNANEKNSDREVFLKKFEQLSLKIEQLTDEVLKMKYKLDKANKINRSFGLKSLSNSSPLDFAQHIEGLGSPTKRYILSIRGITEQWQGRKNDVLIAVRQQDKETHEDLKALGIRIPINDTKTLRILTREIVSLLYISCELKNIEITEILRDILNDVNKDGFEMVNEIKEKMKI